MSSSADSICPFHVVPPLSDDQEFLNFRAQRYISFRDHSWESVAPKLDHLKMLYDDSTSEDAMKWVAEQLLFLDLDDLDLQRIQKASLIYLTAFVVALLWLRVWPFAGGEHFIGYTIFREVHLFVHLRFIFAGVTAGGRHEKGGVDSEFWIVWALFVGSIRIALILARSRLSEWGRTNSSKRCDFFDLYRVATMAFVCLTISSLLATLPMVSTVKISVLYRLFMFLDGVNLVALSSVLTASVIAQVNPRVSTSEDRPTSTPVLLLMLLSQISEFVFYAVALWFGFFVRSRVFALAFVPICVQWGRILYGDLKLLSGGRKKKVAVSESNGERDLTTDT
ncbi:hypothetical protein QR680_009538 [Steinernema hermaphroditum]|uniref:Uncharacterized protein n=1 Tax=Steinernema hermaphroditum TaxID=289476 RepID=A0AA39M9W9_9BILA|nr:hypothetical protein QR680_009538 [Steinernema hermaphroditum]